MGLIDFYTLMAVLVLVLVVYELYDLKKKTEIKKEEIQLERERIALETKKREEEK
ncbi:hypothetical protein B0H94_11078 [Salsuginibacillus halophilus]|uniref:Uncharacterized protein n=1 Tax=Salsuginibacillus halophilus TaxID=517424 RepID=A0A2P8HBK9_9BACI|nr:hypothetical protein [Salsuginibacillus halophilus]PSL43602.1 hypothetical protein B0H94_11078 [Salsuginibacillus halophilus]